MVTYLNDHLVGSAGALDLINNLKDSQPDDKLFYQLLHKEISEDQKILKDMLHLMGEEETTIGQIAGKVAEKVSRIKLEPSKGKGGLGLVESLEVLELGIEGKRLLWKTVLALKASYPE
jgi:hypothetical protein